MANKYNIGEYVRVIDNQSDFKIRDTYIGKVFQINDIHQDATGEIYYSFPFADWRWNESELISITQEQSAPIKQLEDFLKSL